MNDATYPETKNPKALEDVKIDVFLPISSLETSSRRIERLTGRKELKKKPSKNLKITIVV